MSHAATRHLSRNPAYPDGYRWTFRIVCPSVGPACNPPWLRHHARNVGIRLIVALAGIGVQCPARSRHQDDLTYRHTCGTYFPAIRSGLPGPAFNFLVRCSMAGPTGAPAMPGLRFYRALHPVSGHSHGIKALPDVPAAAPIAKDYQSVPRNSLDICLQPPIIENNSHWWRL